MGNTFRKYDLSGSWQVRLPDGTTGNAVLPGTLDTNGIGGPDRPEKQWHDEIKTGRAEDDTFGENPISTRFTRRHTFTGPAEFTRTVTLEDLPAGCRWIVTVERSRHLRLLVNGQEAATLLPGTLSTPWRFETLALQPGENDLCFICDNSYPGWPADAILYSSAATDETQTNWNGLLGRMTLEALPEIILLGARLTCGRKGGEAELQADVSIPDALAGADLTLRFACDALEEGKAVFSQKAEAGTRTLRLPGIRLSSSLRRWEPEHPAFCNLSVQAEVSCHDGSVSRHELAVRTGIRTFEPDERGRLSLNGRRIFLRSEANCAAWPETGHPPMSAEEWKEILKLYQAYGVNCLRFHSHCPPEAAFEAADETGMLMQPELSHWDPEHAFESDVSYAYYRAELQEILRHLGRHPSFVMLTLGNELWCDAEGERRMAALVREAQDFLPDRLFARGSNAFYGRNGCDPESDFYTAQKYETWKMRAISAAGDSEHPTEKARIQGYLNNSYPSAKTNYDEGMEKLRERYPQPMFSFEVGQYEVLPDFHELEQFHGVTDPVNYQIIRHRAERRGMLPVWDRMVEATGEIALIGYREEAEAVMRTPSMSGISLLSLQDFPGQGTALVGMMNAHLRPKAFDFARPERFRAFFRDALPLAELEKYTYTAGEQLRAGIRAVNYSTEDLSGTLALELRNDAGACLHRQTWEGFRAAAGESVTALQAEVPLPALREAAALELCLFLEDGDPDFRSSTRIWIYPDLPDAGPGEVLCARSLSGTVLDRLAAGGRVLLEPPSTKEAFPDGIFGQFSTDFWSVGTFPQQEGGMGLLIAEEHPLFRRFPTSFHTDYQWWLMSRQRSLRLPDERLADAILIRQMDSYAELRSLAMLMELRVGDGRLLLSTMGLPDLPQKPEVRALRRALLAYTQSEEFRPAAAVSAEELRSLLPGCLE